MTKFDPDFRERQIGTSTALQLPSTRPLRVHSGGVGWGYPQAGFSGAKVSVVASRFVHVGDVSGARRTQVGDLVRRMRAALEGLSEAPVWGMVGTELADTLSDLAALRGELDELELRLVAHADRDGVITVPGPHGQTRQCTDPVAWWGRATCQDRRTAVVRARLATALDAGGGGVGARVGCREAMTRGHLSEAQALVIDRALTEIETGWTGADGVRHEVPAEVVALCEKHLVAAAEDHTPRQLRFLGKHVLERVAPEIADDQLRRVIEAEERRAAQRCRLEVWDDGHGTTYGRFQIPTVDGTALKKYLLGFNAPKHRTSLGQEAPAGSVRKPTAQQMGEAFVELIQRFPADRLPDAGGITARLVVTMTLEQLLGTGEGAERPVITDMDELMSAAQARKWACEAQIIPQVLGSGSVVLDQGRATRFHTGAQRVAIATRDRCCTVEGCDVPPGLCQVHHDDPWSLGGHTTVVDGRLACPRHHRQIHDPRHAVTRIGNGKIIITRR